MSQLVTYRTLVPHREAAAHAAMGVAIIRSNGDGEKRFITAFTPV